jgi:hypothetical protein
MNDIGLTGFVCAQEHTPGLNKGLAFLYQQVLIVTGNFWNVVANLDLKWYRFHLELIDLILKQVQTSSLTGKI